MHNKTRNSSTILKRTDSARQVGFKFGGHVISKYNTEFTGLYAIDQSK